MCAQKNCTRPLKRKREIVYQPNSLFALAASELLCKSNGTLRIFKHVRTQIKEREPLCLVLRNHHWLDNSQEVVTVRDPRLYCTDWCNQFIEFVYPQAIQEHSYAADPPCKRRLEF